MSETSTRYAVLIGVDRTANLPALHGPSNDVAAWSTFLKKLNFDEANVKTLTNEEATTANVAAALNGLLAKLDGPEALGFVFFAGHGDLSMNAWTTAFLADYAGQTDLGGGGRQIADAGCLHVNRLRLHAADNVLNPRSAEATLVVVLDACRVTPEGLGATRAPDRQSVEAEWTGNQVLITAARPDELSYERRFFGTARGQLSWALLTVLEEWSVGERGGAAYVEASYAEVVARTNTLIGAISADHQPQHPQVVGGSAALGTAVLRAVGRGPGVVRPGPRRAPGHEWPGDTLGVLIKKGGVDVGWLNTVGGKVRAHFVESTFPASSSTLTFTYPITVSQMLGMTITSNWTAHEGTWKTCAWPTVGMMVDTSRNIGSRWASNGTGWHFYQELPAGTPAQSAPALATGLALSVHQTLTNNNGQWVVAADDFTQDPPPQWPPDTEGYIEKHEAGAWVGYGWFTNKNTGGKLKVHLTTPTFPGAAAKLKFTYPLTAAQKTGLTIQSVWTSTPTLWFVTSVPTTNLMVDTAKKIGCGTSGSTWTWFANPPAPRSAPPVFPSGVEVMDETTLPTADYCWRSTDAFTKDP